MMELIVPVKIKKSTAVTVPERMSGYVTKEDVEAGRYKPLSEGVSLQYANREPRFYASVAYNGDVWNLLNSNKKCRRTSKHTSLLLPWRR